MDTNIKGKNFIVCGATRGFGFAISKLLLSEGAGIIAVGRDGDKLKELTDGCSGKIETFRGDITQSNTIEMLWKHTEKDTIDGILLNASGPPAKSFIETTIDDWDEAYRQIVRWKVELTKKFLPIFIKRKSGRFLYIESAAVKQPFENLILSTSMRLSVVGFVKTLSQEMADKGITFNILAPGYHYTQSTERLITKKAENLKISKKESWALIEDAIPMKKAGNVDNFASLAVWLLSPLANYVTGQVYAIDGGVVKSTL